MPVVVFFVSSPIAILDENGLVCVCVRVINLRHNVISVRRRSDGGNGDDGFWVCHVYPCSLSLSFGVCIVYKEIFHRNVDRLIFFALTVHFYSVLYFNECMGTRVQCVTMSLFARFRLSASAHLHGLRRALAMALSLFGESPSAHRICFIIFLFGQTQLHKCNANISRCFFVVR